jgi:hypothetical protein
MKIKQYQYWTVMRGGVFCIIRQLHASVDAEAAILKYIPTSKKFVFPKLLVDSCNKLTNETRQLKIEMVSHYALGEVTGQNLEQALVLISAM